MAEQLYMVQVTATENNIARTFWHSGGRGNGALAGVYTSKQLPRILGRYKGTRRAKAVPIVLNLTNEQLDELHESSDFLLALQGAGVDNWSGYDYAIEALEEMRGGSENG